MCKCPFPLDRIKHHQQECDKYAVQPVSTTIPFLLITPITTPLSDTEEKLATSLMKRKRKSTNSQQIVLNSGGTPLKLSIVNSVRKNSTEASKKTVQRRASTVEQVRRVITGGTNEDCQIQQVAEFRRLGREERQQFVQEAGLSIEIPPEEGLAMKSELGIPWNKIRHIRRTWKLKLFLFGDYAFLCAIFGLSGASGKLIKL
ncbi:hypothetical protein QZH41_009868 [Actinostola sp. cb2023]|nr:hypothetical protein QZH41_009868 [Actinostola sp. cb2023]